MLELPNPSKLHPAPIVAGALLAAGVTGTVMDPDGPIGITLFGVAAAAALYLITRPFRRARRNASASRPQRMRGHARAAVVPRSAIPVAAAMAGLFTVWAAADLARPLVYVCWWGFCLLAAWLTATTVRAVYRSKRAPR